MKRFLAMTVVWFFGAIAVAEGSDTVSRTIDLNRPGALEALEHSNPQHHEKIREMMEGLVKQPESKVPGWLQVNFEARDVKYGPMLLTSHPPQKYLSFTLDETHYKATVTLAKERAQISPAK